MSSGDPKLRLFSGFAAIGHALGNEHRLRILELLAQRETSVEAVSYTHLTLPTTERV